MQLQQKHVTEVCTVLCGEDQAEQRFTATDQVLLWRRDVGQGKAGPSGGLNIHSHISSFLEMLAGRRSLQLLSFLAFKCEFIFCLNLSEAVLDEHIWSRHVYGLFSCTAMSTPD